MDDNNFQNCESKSEWDAFVGTSPQGTVFSRSWFLDALGTPYRCYLVTKGAERVGGVVVLEDDGGRPLKAPFRFTPYQGILFNDSSAPRDYKRTEAEFEVTQIIINGLLARYGSVSLSHSPHFRDLRPFQWIGYGTPAAPRLLLNVRYTAVLDLQFRDADEYLSQIQSVRRREYRKAEDVAIEVSRDIELLEALYRKTFARQGIDPSAEELRHLRRIATAALDSGTGELRIGLVDGTPVTATLFLFDDRQAYYLFGGTDPAARSSGASTKLMIDNILAAKSERGLQTVDFVGCNSPQRGFYKQSFNPRLEPYYETHLSIPEKTP